MTENDDLGLKWNSVLLFIVFMHKPIALILPHFYIYFSKMWTVWWWFFFFFFYFLLFFCISLICHEASLVQHGNCMQFFKKLFFILFFICNVCVCVCLYKNCNKIHICMQINLHQFQLPNNLLPFFWLFAIFSV